jgi:DNA-directed RNA polymerase subunit RPC12/RpoP
MDDMISRQAVLSLAKELKFGDYVTRQIDPYDVQMLPSAQPERLTDDDFETIRIHLNAYKEKLCNQHRWKEAEKYQRIIDRFMTFASAQPERKTGKWELLPLSIIPPVYKCSACGRHAVWITTGCLVNRHEESYLSDFCPNCGAYMRGEQNGQ